MEDAETGDKSDYDFLVVVETEAQVADVMLWGEIEQRVRAVIGDTPLTLIVYDVKFVKGCRVPTASGDGALLSLCDSGVRAQDVELLGNLAGEQHALEGRRATEDGAGGEAPV